MSDSTLTTVCSCGAYLPLPSSSSRDTKEETSPTCFKPTLSTYTLTNPFDFSCEEMACLWHESLTMKTAWRLSEDRSAKFSLQNWQELFWHGSDKPSLVGHSSFSADIIENDCSHNSCKITPLPLGSGLMHIWWDEFICMCRAPVASLDLCVFYFL